MPKIFRSYGAPCVIVEHCEIPQVFDIIEHFAPQLVDQNSRHFAAIIQQYLQLPLDVKELEQFQRPIAQCFAAYRREEYAITIPCLVAVLERGIRQLGPADHFYTTTFTIPRSVVKILNRDTLQGMAPPLRYFMGGLLKKILLVDLFQALWVTFRNQNPKYIYTEQYPTERPRIAERYRGAPRLNINPDTNETLCISCNLCALACPENLIVVTSVRNEQTRRKDLTTFSYDLSRCMFCGLCEDACPVDALELTQDFELASYTREGGIWDRQMLEEGPRPIQYT